MKRTIYKGHITYGYHLEITVSTLILYGNTMIITTEIIRLKANGLRQSASIHSRIRTHVNSFMETNNCQVFLRTLYYYEELQLVFAPNTRSQQSKIVSIKRKYFTRKIVSRTPKDFGGLTYLFSTSTSRRLTYVVNISILWRLTEDYCLLYSADVHIWNVLLLTITFG